MTIRIPPEFKILYQPFIKKFLHGEVHNFSFQRKYYRPLPGKPDMMYSPEKDDKGIGVKLEEHHWITHFFTAPFATKTYSIGSLAMNMTFERSILKWVIVDLDDPVTKAKAEKLLIPALEARGVEYIWEYGGDNDDRAHVWIAIDTVERPLVEAYFNQLLIEVGLSRSEFDEIYPLFQKRKNLIRLPGGFHLRRMRRYPCRYNGEISVKENDEIDIPKLMRMFINVKPLTADEMRKYVKDVIIVDETKKKNVAVKDIKYHSLNLPLPLPVDQIPETLVRPLQNCQAMRQTLLDIMGKTDHGPLLNKRTGTSHDAGLAWARFSMYNDIVLSSFKKKIETGKKFFNMLVSKFRYRPPASHNWDSNFSEMRENPDRYYWSCEAMERFGYCDGCPFKGTIVSPKNFHWGEDIVREILEPVTLKTPDEIRQTTFKEFKSDVKHAMMFGMGEVIHLASPQGAGKSWLIGDLIRDNPGKTYVILVPDGNLAMQHKRKLDSEGIASFVLMGYENSFKYKLSDFDCTQPAEVKRLNELGMSGPYIRENICEQCPLYEDCHWPQQYKLLKEDYHRVIIMQHAHLGTPVMFDVVRKNPDLVFIDETFIHSLFKFIKPTAREISLIRTASHIDWTGKLADWLERGGWADGEIDPSEEQMESLRLFFSEKKAPKFAIQDERSIVPPWSRIVDFIRAFRGKNFCSAVSGVRIVNDLPTSPLMALTDATAPKELIEALAGIKITKVIGANEVIDVTRVHPGNKVIQVLDGSVSQAALEKDDLLYEYLAKIGFECQTKHAGKQVLITVYKKWVPRIVEYFKSHSQYRSVVDRIELASELINKKPRPDSITIDWMRRGTNRYVTYDAQYLMAGVFATGDQFELTAYQHRSVANYRLEMDGKEAVNNMFPYDTTPATRIEREPIPFQCIMKIDGKGVLVRFPQFLIWVPVDKWHRLQYGLHLGSFQQANRIRWMPDKARELTILGCQPMDGQMVTEVQTRSQFCNSL